jgi:hypothetical protein
MANTNDSRNTVPLIKRFATRAAMLLAAATAVFAACGQGPRALEEGIGSSEQALSAPFTTPIRTKVGTFENGSWHLDVNGNGKLEACGVDRCFNFGGTGDQPVVGAWLPGGGSASVGVFRPGDKYFYLDLNGNGNWDGCGAGQPDKCNDWSSLAQPGDIAVAGDWAGTGQASVGLFRPSTHTWYLDWDRNGLWDGCGVGVRPDVCVSNFGDPGDLPVVGRWNTAAGAGDSIGVFHAATKQIWLDWNGDRTWGGCGTGQPDRCVTGGQTGDRPVAGVWDTTVGVWDPTKTAVRAGVYRSGLWVLDANGNLKLDSCSTDTCVNPYGTSTSIPVFGAWPPTRWSPASDLDATYFLPANTYWETSSAVIAPGANAACPNGRVFIGVGGPYQVLQMDLSCTPGATCQVTTTTNVLPKMVSPVPAFDSNDNLTIATSDYNGGPLKNVLHIRQGKTSDSFGTRFGYYIWSTNDCGTTWQSQPFIDSRSVLDGHCALRQKQETVGYFRPSDHTFRLDGDHDMKESAGDRLSAFIVQTKDPDDLPVTGEWDGLAGDGKTKIGLFRRGSWYLDWNNNGIWDGCPATGGGPDVCGTFGQAGDTPFAVRVANTGEFRSRLAVWRKATGEWFVDTNGNYAWDGCGIDSCGQFGGNSDLPVVGSWNNLGLWANTPSHIGVFNAGRWSLDTSGDGFWNSANDTLVTGYGNAGDIAVTGVFTPSPNYREQFATFNAGNWHIDWNDNRIYESCGGNLDNCPSFGMAGDIPLVGNWIADPGGFDRPEAYFDPSNGMFYMTFGCDYRDKSETLLLSLARGKSWNAQVVPTSGRRRPRPLMITSSLGTNKVHFFGPLNSNPAVWPAAADPNTGIVTIEPYWFVYQQEGQFAGPNEPTNSSTFPDLIGNATFVNRDGSFGFTRMSTTGTTDRLRAMYPSRDSSGIQTMRVMEIDVTRPTSGNSTVKASSLGTISAAASTGSATQAAMIDPPYWPGSTITGSLIHWKESGSNTSPYGPVNARAMVARDNLLSLPFWLSRDGAGNTRTWDSYATPKGEGNQTGDYIKGASFFWDGREHFVTHWIETPSSTPDARSIHVEVISTMEL